MPWKSKPRHLKKSFSSDLEGGKESARWGPGGSLGHQGVQQGRGSATSPHVAGTAVHTIRTWGVIPGVAGATAGYRSVSLLMSLATGGIQTSHSQLEFNVRITRHRLLNPQCQALQGTAARWKPSALPSGPWGSEQRVASNQEPVRTQFCRQPHGWAWVQTLPGQAFKYGCSWLTRRQRRCISVQGPSPHWSWAISCVAVDNQPICRTPQSTLSTSTVQIMTELLILKTISGRQKEHRAGGPRKFAAVVQGREVGSWARVATEGTGRRG